MHEAKSELRPIAPAENTSTRPDCDLPDRSEASHSVALTVEETLYYSQQADMVMLIPGMERVDGRTVRWESPTALDAYRTFIATALIAGHPAVAGR